VEAVLWAGLFQQLQSFATHANTRGRMGWLNLVIGTAELHRRHHGTQVEEALNFGTAIPLWDQLFGTFRFRCTREPAAVGVAHPERYPASSDWWGLMRLPL
jgi:sterol desaturase/sphingolipid hydroxylase (fatty acid hydroxylase superfamily)